MELKDRLAMIVKNAEAEAENRREASEASLERHKEETIVKARKFWAELLADDTIAELIEDHLKQRGHRVVPVKLTKRGAYVHRTKESSRAGAGTKLELTNWVSPMDANQSFHRDTEVQAIVRNLEAQSIKVTVSPLDQLGDYVMLIDYTAIPRA